jgi:hypothetical protein
MKKNRKSCVLLKMDERDRKKEGKSYFFPTRKERKIDR